MVNHFLPKSLLLGLSIILLITIKSVAATTFLDIIDIQVSKFTLSAIDIPLGQVFSSITKQTGLKIINNVSETKLFESKKITVNFNHTEIKEVMTSLLNDRYDLQYVIEKNNITIYNKLKPAKIGASNRNIDDTSQVKFNLSGKIIDSSGTPIPGATIRLKNSKYGAISNPDGFFTLSNVSLGEIVQVTSLGYESYEAKLRGNNITVQLKTYANKLDEKIIIAYGTTTKRYNTGNVNGVKEADIQKQPVNNPLLALSGRVPGVFIEQATGLPGTGVTVNIQGTNSIRFGNDPFYVIDGVPYISQLLQPTIAGITAGNKNVTGSPFNFINPSDIESIQVLKDADATAIYGSRAANGAILITTKKGKPGAMRLDLNMQKGIGQVGRFLHVFDAKQYLTMRHEALSNGRITSPSPSDYDLNGLWDTTQEKNWQKQLVGRNAQYTDVQLSVSGGSELTQYWIGGGYHRETSVFPGNYSDTKASVHFNTKSTSANKKLYAIISGSYMKDNNKLPNIDLTGVSLQLSPIAPSLFNSDGSVNWQPKPSGSTTYFANPMTYIKNKNTNKTNNLTSQLTIGYEIALGISAKVTGGYNLLTSEEMSPYLLSSNPPEYWLLGVRRAASSNSQVESWLVEPQIEFNKEIAGGHLNVLLGGTIQKNNSSRTAFLASGFSNDLVIEDIKSATSIIATESVQNTYKYNALMARINYNWLGKYILNLTTRRDGSSRFGPANQFHNFGSVGAAWIFSQTEFMKNFFPFLSFGKIRGSYGTTGSDQIPDYLYLDLYQVQSIDVPYQQTLGSTPSRLFTPNLQWEETKKLQFGLELGLLHDKILFNINYNRNRSSNQLMGTNLPSITGFLSILNNFNAVVQNTGWEVTLNSTNIQTKNFTWATSFNLTVPQNKLVSYKNTTNTSLVVGKPITIQSVFQFAGVNDSTGLYQFIDEKGKPSPSPPSVPNKYINIDPSFYGGLQNSFSYKGFNLDIFFQFTRRVGQDLTYGYGSVPGVFSSGKGNQPITLLDHWKKVGDIASHAKYSSTYDQMIALAYARLSDISYVDASYIKLKNVSLSWQLPEKWVKSAKIYSARLYILGQNLLTISNYFGLDPESRGTSLPPLRVITFGAQITL